MSEHHHDHHHEHHDEAEEIVENALIIGKTGHISLPFPASSQDIEDEAAEILLEVAGILARGNIVPGHVKAALRCKERSCTISVTRPGQADRISVGESEAVVSEYELTVNILSVLPPAQPLEPFLKRLFHE